MKVPALLLLLSLAACGTTQIVYKPVPVNVPVEVPCHAPDIAAPAMPTAAVAPTASMFEKTKAALAELKIRAGYEGQLKAAIAACQ